MVAWKGALCPHDWLRRVSPSEVRGLSLDLLQALTCCVLVQFLGWRGDSIGSLCTKHVVCHEDSVAVLACRSKTILSVGLP